MASFSIFFSSFLLKHCWFFLQAKSNAPRVNQRKKLRKSTIILVSDPPPSSQPENSEVPKSKKQNEAVSATFHHNIGEAKVLAVNIPPRLPSSRPDNAASAPKAEGSSLDPDNSPLKVRAARKAASSNGGVPLWDRNAAKLDEPVNKKEPEVVPSRSPLRPKRIPEEKENNRR